MTIIRNEWIKRLGERNNVGCRRGCSFKLIIAVWYVLIICRIIELANNRDIGNVLFAMEIELCGAVLIGGETELNCLDYTI